METIDLATSKFKKWRKSNITIYRIAKELGITWPTVKRWENGDHEISYEYAKKILDTEI
jgi:DNA-binding transcriptional regulator YiaG